MEHIEDSQDGFTVTSVRDMAEGMAYASAKMRDRLLFLLENKTHPAYVPLSRMREIWPSTPNQQPRAFASDVAQVLSCLMVHRALSGSDGSLHDILSIPISYLTKEPLFSAVQVELGHLETLISAIDVAKVTASSDRRGEPWLYFYEDFLGVYDPVERKQAGVYYTPTAVVRAMVAMVDHILVEQFGLRSGFADPSVVTLDPAVGTGTFPLAVLDRAAERMEAQRGPAGRAQVAANLAKNLYGFELLPGPYAVAQLRLTQRLRELDPTHARPAQVLLTDTLESPDGIIEGALPLFGDARVLATEQNRAKVAKAQQRVTVVIGNPPYRRVRRTVQGRGSGGWVVSGSTPPPAVPGSRKLGRAQPIFDDVLSVARKAGLGVHLKNVYNLYAYFWRWAQWKAFEHHGDQPGVVAFITGSSWLTGDAFVGLRDIARRACDDIYVLDLGGDNRGANPDQNVFAIETPVAVVVLVRSAPKDSKTPARVWYRRVEGNAAEKLVEMEALAQTVDPLGGEWQSGPRGWLDPFVPAATGEGWLDHSALGDLFPWIHTGAEWQRTWATAPSGAVLERRWRYLLASSGKARQDAFSENRDRQISQTYQDLFSDAPMTPVAELPESAPTPPIVRYGLRSFDRQWCLADNRIGTVLKPDLWRTLGSRQIFFSTLLSSPTSSGPCLTATPYVPDKHHFRGSFGGKDILPLYRDASAKQPNITRGLLAAIAKVQGGDLPTPEDLAAYVYALLSAPAYQTRFEAHLQTPGPRVPMTADGALWCEGVELGTWLLWLHTYCERLRGSGRGRYVPNVPGLSWQQAVHEMPATSKDIGYDPVKQELRVGDGMIRGVRPEVWEFSVSGMPVVKKWLGYRTAKGAGRAASSDNPLDQIRPTSWPDEWNDELLDLLWVLTHTCDKHAQQADLLERICAGPLIAAADLPKPKPAERQPPVREQSVPPSDSVRND